MKTLKPVNSSDNLGIISTTEEEFLEHFGDFKAGHFIWMGIPELPIWFDPYTRTAYILSLDLAEVK